jgi:hypothetical protein
MVAESRRRLGGSGTGTIFSVGASRRWRELQRTRAVHRRSGASGAFRRGRLLATPPRNELRRELAKCYGLPIEVGTRTSGLAAVAHALSCGEVARAQIIALHLRIPDPSRVAKAARSADDWAEQARRLISSGLLKAGWDSTKHPRWAAGSPGGAGGEFAPSGATVDETGSGGPARPIRTAQAAIPFPIPFELPGIPSFPGEIVVPPILGPDVHPRELPQNPYPDRPECVEEWAHAYEFCRRLKREGKMGRDGYRGLGSTIDQCLRGQVSADCGGNRSVV